MRQSQSSVQFTGNVKKRWDSLQGDVSTANTQFAALNIAKSQAGVITGIIAKTISCKGIADSRFHFTVYRREFLSHDLSAMSDLPIMSRP